MKRGRPTIGSQSSSRNTDYYVKKVRPNDSSGMKSLKTFFKSTEHSKPAQPQNALEESSLRIDGNTQNERNVLDSASKGNQDSNVENILPTSSTNNETDIYKEHSINELSILATVSKYEKSKDWVFYSPSAGGYLCKVCSVMNNSKGAWVTVGVNFHGHPSRVNETHEDRKMHWNSASTIYASRKTVISRLQEGADKVNEKSKENNIKVMKKFISVIYFMVKKRWAVLENFESVIHFLGSQLHDEDIKLHLDTCAKNATYLSHYSVQNILGCIGNYIEESMLVLLRASNAFALLADESTDKAQREQLGLIARFKVRNQENVKEVFLGLISLSQTDAASIMKAIEHFMLAKNLCLKKCLFVSLDGANVMSGEITGLQRRIKHYSPHCIYINCRNHRLALVFAHLVKKYSNLKSVDTLLISLWKIFHYSPQKYSVLKNIQENVYNIKTLKMLKVSLTRWLSHSKACARVAARFKEIVETLDAVFEKTKEPEIKGVREQLLNPDIFLTILFMADLLKIVDHLNLWLQRKSITFSNINENVLAVVNRAEDLCKNLNQGSNFSKSEEFLLFSVKATELSKKLRRNQLTTNNVTRFKRDFVVPFLEDFKTEMKIAFEIKDGCALTGFDAFLTSPKDCIDESERERNWSILLSHYGNEKKNEFQGSIAVAAPVINSNEAHLELLPFQRELEASVMTFEIKKLEKMKVFIRKNLKEEANLCMQEKITPLDLINILEEKETAWDEFPNLMSLLSLCVIIPSSTASVERLFSQMNLVCTKLRSNLSQKSLDTHLQIIINGPENLSNDQVSGILDVFRTTENRRILL